MPGVTKNLQPKADDAQSCERRIRITRMKRTITKMLQAHNSMTAAKLLSAKRPLPRLLRNSRIGRERWIAGAAVQGFPSMGQA